MNEPTLKLPRGADELLREFPMVEPDFEVQAKAIQVRLKGDVPVTDPGALLPPSAGMALDDLLKAPALAAEAGEPGSASSVRASEPPKSNFAEMARKSVQKKDDDSAHKELLAATAQSRRPSAEMVERVRAAGRPSATTTPLPSSDAGIEEAQRTSGVVARAETAKPESGATSGARPTRGALIGVAAGVLALAACVALFLKSGDSENRTTAALAAEKASETTVAPGAARPLAPTEAKASEDVMSPEALAAAPEAAGRDAAKGAAPKSGSGAGLAAAPSKGAAGPKAGAKQEAVVLQDDPQPSKPAPAEAKPEPVAEPPLKPAQGSSGSVPLTPSAGAVSTALSSVRGSAQACLAGQTEAVTATVTFAADGRVLRVGAAGPSAACIQAALAKARITPFAKDSFSATTTIRPP